MEVPTGVLVVLGLSHVGRPEHALVVGGGWQVRVQPDKKIFQKYFRNIKYLLELVQLREAGSNEASSKLL